MRDLISDPEFILKKKLESIIVSLGIENWIPQYTMVTFSDLPYSQAQERGHHQAFVLEQLRKLENWNDLEEAEWAEKVAVHLEMLWP
jgi:kynurenine 3-monooxygenase